MTLFFVIIGNGTEKEDKKPLGSKPRCCVSTFLSNDKIYVVCAACGSQYTYAVVVAVGDYFKPAVKISRLLVRSCLFTCVRSYPTIVMGPIFMLRVLIRESKEI